MPGDTLLGHAVADAFRHTYTHAESLEVGNAVTIAIAVRYLGFPREFLDHAARYAQPDQQRDQQLRGLAVTSGVQVSVLVPVFDLDLRVPVNIWQLGRSLRVPVGIWQLGGSLRVTRCLHRDGPERERQREFRQLSHPTPAVRERAELAVQHPARPESRLRRAGLGQERFGCRRVGDPDLAAVQSEAHVQQRLHEG